MLYLEEVVLDAPYVEDIDSCKTRIFTGAVANETIQGVVSRSGIYKVVVELRAPSVNGQDGSLIAVCKAYAIQWKEVADEIAELQAGWGGVDDIDFKEALREVNPGLAELSKLFTKQARLRANSLAGDLSCNFNVWRRRGPMCPWEEKGESQNIALLDYILVSQENRGRGLGRKMVNALRQKLCERFSTTHIIAFPSALNVSKMAFSGLGDNMREDAGWIREQNYSIRFHRQLGFRRLFGTKFFCWTYDEDHAARKMTVDEDEMRDRALGLGY